MSWHRSIAELLVVAAGCGATPAPTHPATAARISIIAAERGPEGARLVVLDEGGDRQFELLEAPGALARDSHPAVSPDGAWIVFASSRGRPVEQTSLWLARLGPQQVPIRLTDGVGVDSHPVWTPDGRSIIFASTRDGGDFDLFRVEVDRGRVISGPEPLTAAEGHEVTPAVARDGTVYYAAIRPVAEGQVESHIEARALDGSIRRVTEGPADTSPALSPDERVLAFARPVQHTGGPDGELWTMPVDGASVAAPLVDLPLTDESGPVWSPDGRYIFATSVLRGAAGNVVFSSVIVIDTRARPIKARLLSDRVGAIARLTPAVTRTPLDHAALAADPEYLPELARIMAPAMANPKDEQGTP